MAERKSKISGSLTIRQLEVFAVAARSSTFSEAARRLDISQPTLSNMIAKMEELLNLSLFDRTTRTMSLTAEGERLSTVAQDLVRTFQASLRNIHDTARKRHGRLSMAVLPSIASAIAPEAIQLFLREFPDFDIALHDTDRQVGLLWVLDRIVDFGILTAAPNLSELRSEVIHTDPFVVFVHADNPLSGKTMLDWSDVEEENLILTGTPQIRRDIESQWSQAGCSITPRFEVTNIETGLSLVAAGLGVTVLPQMFMPEARGRSIRAVPLKLTDFARDIEIVHRVDRSLSEPVEHMISCFRTAFAHYRDREVRVIAKPKSPRRTKL